jgi:ribosomal protein S18 acetylase RimI-like enzyme
MNIQLQAIELDNAQFYQAARVYAWVWQRSPEASAEHLRYYAQLTAFQGYLATAGMAAVGMGIGIAAQRGEWWYDRVAQVVGSEHPALQDAWILMELAVLPLFQNRGIGVILHDALLHELPFPNVLLSTAITNVGAQRFYQRLGWQVLQERMPFFHGGSEYMIMHFMLQ